MVGAPACGDVMRLRIKVRDDGIEDANSRPMVAIRNCIQFTADRVVKGKTLDEARAIKNTDIAEELALPPVKIHCSVPPRMPSRPLSRIIRKKADYSQRVLPRTGPCGPVSFLPHGPSYPHGMHLPVTRLIPDHRKSCRWTAWSAAPPAPARQQWTAVCLQQFHHLAGRTHCPGG